MALETESHEEIGFGGDFLDGRQYSYGRVLSATPWYPEIGTVSPVVVVDQRCLLLRDREGPHQRVTYGRQSTDREHYHDCDLEGRSYVDGQMQQ